MAVGVATQAYPYFLDFQITPAECAVQMRNVLKKMDSLTAVSQFKFKGEHLH